MSASSPASNPAQQGATQRHKQKNERSGLLPIYLKYQELRQRQLNAIDLLLRGLSDAQVAQQVGVDRGTIFRWRKDSEFAAELDRQRQVLMQQSVGRLQSMLEPALDILQKQISGDDPKTALRAAAILLRVATPARLARLAGADESARQPSRQRDEIDDLIENFVEAPMPNEPGHPAYERRRIQSQSPDSDSKS